MIITPKDAPVPTQQTVSARDRALANLQKAMESNSQPTAEMPVKNATSISPEEAVGLQSQSSEILEEKEEEQSQSDNSEETESVEAKEAPEETKEVKAEEETSLSSQYAQLARKEKAIRAKAQEIKAQEEAIKAERAAIEAERQKLSGKPSLEERLQKNPKDVFKILAEMGLSYDKLTELALEGDSSPSNDAALEELRAELKAIKEGQEQTRKMQEEAQQSQYKQAISMLRSEATKLVSTRAEEFETIREMGEIDSVVDLIEERFKSEGIVMSVEDAAREVEEYLVEEATKVARIKKIQQRLAPPQASKTKEASPKLSGDGQKQQAKTLTNATGSPRQLSTRERAILAAKGELK